MKTARKNLGVLKTFEFRPGMNVYPDPLRDYYWTVTKIEKCPTHKNTHLHVNNNQCWSREALHWVDVR